MQRFFLNDLLRWRDDPERKPLVISGARQVGKSYVVQKLLAPHFERFVEINFEFDRGATQCFSGPRLDPGEIVRRLEVYLNTKIEPGKTLLFLDEAQQCESALASLRYFHEQLPQLHVIAAGSLIEFALEQISMPVGRITTRYLTPLSFEEYLVNAGHERFLEHLRNQDFSAPIQPALHTKGLHVLKEYLAIGGMPSAVQSFLTHQDYLRVDAIHQDLLDTYRLDFPKYARRSSELHSVPIVFEQAPRLVCKQFSFTHISRELRAQHIRAAIDLLAKANVFQLIYAAHGYPLPSSYEPARYKLLFLDIGLLQRASGLRARDVVLQEPRDLANGGQLAEQFVGQSILAHANFRHEKLFYWERHREGADAEVDYLVQRAGKLVPIEVKAGALGSLKSLRYYLSTTPTTELGIKVSADNITSVQVGAQRILALPLYAWPAWLSRHPS